MVLQTNIRSCKTRSLTSAATALQKSSRVEAVERLAQAAASLSAYAVLASLYIQPQLINEVSQAAVAQQYVEHWVQVMPSHCSPIVLMVS